MSAFNFDYAPENLVVSGKPDWVSATDGDTPTLQLPVRMLGMDAPELHYGGATIKNPGKYDDQMENFLSQKGASLEPGLKIFLKKRLTAKPCSHQIGAGQAAYEHFQAMVKERLDRGLGKNGKPLTPRNVFIMVSQEVFDRRYGRLLAYVNAEYEKKEREAIPPSKRPTFNLQMMQDGHAVSLLIYPNIPKPSDLKLVQGAVKKARTGHLGLWRDKGRTLLPYEFRWIIDTMQGKRQGPDRYCGDISTGKLFTPQNYYRVLPENRLFFFKEQIGEAIKMGFELKV
jgi:endonuclease YncB( thermonuclease family)